MTVADTARNSAFVGFACSREGHPFHGVPTAGSSCVQCRASGITTSVRAVYERDRAIAGWSRRSGRGVWRYATLMPIGDREARVDLGAGGTPILPWRGDADDALGLQIWLKNESANPTWSYKDRLATVAASAAVEAGARVLIASSTGNHGAATAAAAAAAGLRSVVLTRPDTSLTTTTFLQMLGAKVFKTTPTGRWELLQRAVTELGWYPMSSSSQDALGSPHGIEGHKSLAFELYESLGRVPHAVVVPSCYGEGLSGIWQGFLQLNEIGVTSSLPAMIAVEPEGGAPLARTLSVGAGTVQRVRPFVTIAPSIAGTSSSDRALDALRASGGGAIPVSDQAVSDAQRRLGQHGLFVEPAAAAGLAAVATRDLRAEYGLPEGGDVVVVLTGGGLRTVDTLTDLVEPVVNVHPDDRGLGTIANSLR